MVVIQQSTWQRGSPHCIKQTRDKKRQICKPGGRRRVARPTWTDTGSAGNERWLRQQTTQHNISTPSHIIHYLRDYFGSAEAQQRGAVIASILVFKENVIPSRFEMPATLIRAKQPVDTKTPIRPYSAKSWQGQIIKYPDGRNPCSYPQNIGLAGRPIISHSQASKRNPGAPIHVEKAPPERLG